MVAAHIKLVEVVVENQGNMGHGPGADFTFKSRGRADLRVNNTHADDRIIQDAIPLSSSRWKLLSSLLL